MRLYGNDGLGMVWAILSSLPSEIYRFMMFFMFGFLGLILQIYGDELHIRFGNEQKVFSPCVFFSPDERETRTTNWGGF